MEEKTRATTTAGKSWGKRIGIGVGILLILFVAVYFIGTSSAFLKAVVLPRAGAALNANITAGEISVSPFSRAQITRLRVETTGNEPLLTAEEVLLRYSLMDIIRGNINVDEVTLNTPVITIVQNADGTSNLDPILKSEKKDEPEKPSSDEPTKLSVKNVSLKNGTVRQIQHGEKGALAKTELSDINVTLDRLGNDQSGNLKLSSKFSMEQQASGTNSALAGEISGGYELALNQDLLPKTVKGSSKVTLAQGTGSFKDLSGLSTSLDADLTPTEIKQAGLKFARNNQALGQVSVSGPLDLQKKEGNLKLVVASLDKNILALATAGQGYDFRNSTLNSTNQIVLSQNGTFFAASGNVFGNTISLSKENLVTPEMNLNVDYQIAVNTSEKTALLEKLNLSGTSGGKEFLRTTLDQQMNLSWGETVKGYKDAAMRIVVTNFNLADWKALLGTNLQSGQVNATVSIVSQKDGRLLTTDFNGGIDNLSASFGSNRLQNATVTLESNATVEDLKVVNLTRYALALLQGANPVLKASGTARHETEKKETTAQLTAEGSLERLFVLAAIPEAKASEGLLKLSGNYTDVGGKRKANGNVALENFSGRYEPYQFTNFQAAFEYNVEMENQVLDIHRAAAKFAQGFNSGGNIELKGRYNFDSKAGQFDFQAVDLNQNTFAPVLAPSLGENQLVSISMNASGEAKLDPVNENSVKTEVKIANWVVQNKAGTMPTTPLSAELKVDGGMKNETLNLRQLLVQLSPTVRAKNALQMQAKLDLGKTNPAPSTVSIHSESFDVTPYYNMFAAGTNTAAAPGTPAPKPAGGAPAETKPETEPEPMTLPFQQLAADLKIDRFYLRDIAISNWVGNVTIQSNVVQLNPFKLEVNGGAMNVTGNFDVGKPGYIYQLGFSAKDVPLAPLANSLELVYSNQLQGTFVADAQLRGAGITGPNIKKNLGGQINFNLTNINYTVGGPKIRRILVPISIALKAPELAETPINWVTGQTVISNGLVRVQNASVESEAFFATLAGTVALENVLTNSVIDLPMDFSLRRSLAEKSKIIPPNTPEDVKYVKLGNIYSVRGTVGDPQPDANKTVLAGLALRGVGGLIGDEKTSQVLGGIGNILTGNKPAGTNATGTATNNTSSPLGGVLDSVGGLLKNRSTATSTNAAGTPGAKGATNAPATNAPARNPLEGLLKSIQGPKQQ